MARDVDPKKTRKALRQLKRALAQAEADGVDLSEWEREFAESLEERLETFGSGFADPDKGDLDEALSALQALKIKEIAKKGKAKTRFGGGAKRSGFGARSRPRGRDIADEADRDEAEGAGEGDRGRSPDLPNRTRSWGAGRTAVSRAERCEDRGEPAGPSEEGQSGPPDAAEDAGSARPSAGWRPRVIAGGKA